VFVFLEGVFSLGLGSDHAGVAICLFQEGDLQTKAEDPRGRSVEVVWKQGSIIYLAGDTTFKSSGEGRIVCIFVRFEKCVLLAILEHSRSFTNCRILRFCNQPKPR